MEFELNEAQSQLPDYSQKTVTEPLSYNRFGSGADPIGLATTEKFDNRFRIPYASTLNATKPPENEYLTPKMSNATEYLKNFASMENVSNMYQSEAARHIITEISESPTVNNDAELLNSANRYKRNTPREKKRHYTAPNTLNSEAMQKYLADNITPRNVCITLKIILL